MWQLDSLNSVLKEKIMRKYSFYSLVLVVYFFSSVIFSSISFAKDKLYVYAASSMTTVVDRLVSAYNTNNDIKVVPVYGGTGSLARQIQHGAPADIFIAANRDWMDYLTENSIINRDSVTYLASNQLVVIAPKETKKQLEIEKVESWLALIGNSKLAIGSVDFVPVGTYSKQVLDKLNLWQAIQPKLVFTKSVRMVLALVEQNALNVGIVYRTDALLSSKVKIVATIPVSLHQPISYPLAALNNKPETLAFFKFIQSEQSLGILSEYGFLTPLEAR